MKGCPLCNHPKIDDMMASLARGRPIGLVAYYFRIDKIALVRHCRHGSIAQVSMPTSIDTPHADVTPPTVDTPVAPCTAIQDSPALTTAMIESSGEGERVWFLTDADLETPLTMLRRGIPFIQEAVRLAGDNRQEQERIVAALNQALAADDMGL